MRRDPLNPRVVGLAKLRRHRRQGKDRGREDDGDNARHVDLQRDVRGGATVLATTNHALGVLDRDAALGLLDVDDSDRDEEKQGNDSGDRTPLASLADRQELLGQTGGDRREDQQRHAVTDAALSDELAEPHDDAGARHHDGNHQDKSQDGAVLDDVLVARLEELTAACQRDRRGCLQDT